MKQKKIPNWVSNRVLSQILRSKLGIIVSYWIFQGMLYADYREVLFKLVLDAALTALLSAILDAPVYLSLSVAHTLNMLFNGHVIAMRRHMGLGINDPARFLAYIESFGDRVKNKPYILGAAAYGSLTRNAYRPTSDIDVRIVPKDDIVSFYCACVFTLAERSRAFLYSFPLDIYVFDVSMLKTKMSLEEAPMVFHDPENVLENSYKKVIDAAKVIAAFRAVHV